MFHDAFSLSAFSIVNAGIALILWLRQGVLELSKSTVQTMLTVKKTAVSRVLLIIKQIDGSAQFCWLECKHPH